MTEVFNKEIAKKFLKELSPSEQYYFLNKVNEAVYKDGYTPDEDLFYYCYFLTLKERLRTITSYRTEGYLRYIYAEGLKDVEDSIKLYKERIDSKRGLSGRDIPKRVK
ncbi:MULTISPECIES: hypothetical protein [Thermodesulfovibrio]|uniref:Uncharacterized protein n=1 Tax=Thermodesulfovibrio yellowstonii (strain ATCC 51303 / DSM 11347 / YP87) TaxID=289376 RepID=B5YJF6_THEYD|nr:MULTISPECIES: hypothetical protein [Thermodesulfovibrio]ACI21327.1 hypothetical protein THEYE_A0528 [Thermodesulfovibrio yellowstonii DSM 11347]MDI6864376.1 hypothetical protein [Thermodesulfovibrio yellowstonii]